jgi:hypothetical protein
MGVGKWESCRVPIPVLKAVELRESVEAVKGIAPPVSNCESLPRYGEGPEEDGKEKAVQPVGSFSGKSCEVRVPVKAAEEESGNEVVSETMLPASVSENNEKSQLIDWLPLP